MNSEQNMMELTLNKINMKATYLILVILMFRKEVMATMMLIFFS